MSKQMAEQLAEEVRQMMEMPGWRVLMRLIQIQQATAGDLLLTAGRTEQSVDAVAMDLKWRQGFVEGVMAMKTWIDGLLLTLDSGQVPEEFYRGT